MEDPKNTTVLKNGQLAVATAPQSGTIVSAASEKETTALVETDDGTQLCVKTVSLGGGGGGGSSDYSDLSNKPKINNVTLSGNKTGADLGLLSNTATGDNSLTILGTASTYSGAVNVGTYSEAYQSGVAIGTGAKAQGSNNSIAIGQNARAAQYNSIAMGYGASATGHASIQIGQGTNSTANTVQIKGAQILDADNKIPADRTARVVELTTTSVELASGDIYNGAELASVTFTLPANVPANFTAQLNFTSGTTATTFTAPASVTFEGDACSNGVFTPLASKRYSVLIYTDGVNVIGLVMGN
jgi:hypothetical protein